MDTTTYIESGILELYVSGTLSEAENQEISLLIQQHPELRKEVEAIEAVILQMTAAASQRTNAKGFSSVKHNLGLSTPEVKIISLPSSKTNTFLSLGWAAAILLAVGLFWLLNEQSTLRSDIETAQLKQLELEQEMAATKLSLNTKKALLDVFRNDSLIPVSLNGSGAFAGMQAKVYWSKTSSRIYLDAQSLPAPPAGKVYQVWSLTLNPLVPTSLGTLDDFNADDDKLFEIANNNPSQAFGITLEPTGGSASPTMEQLYTLGVVQTL
jgi:anti-sigma-K factor RskA